MDKNTMDRLGIELVKKMRSATSNNEIEKISIALHSDGAVGVNFHIDMANLIVEDVSTRYMQFGYASDVDRLYMWGDKEGFTVTLNKASKNRGYVSTKSLAAVLKKYSFPKTCEVHFDTLVRCYYIDLTEGEKA